MTDSDNLKLLNDLVARNTGKLINFGRSLEVYYPNLWSWVQDQTPWLPCDVKFTERVYALVNDFKERPRCPITDKPLLFKNFFKGYNSISWHGLRVRAKERQEIPKPIPPTHAALLEYAAMIGSDEISVGSKIKKLINRNRERNAALYELSDNQEGIDYVVCPVLGIRTEVIRRTYIGSVLGLTVDEFKQRYPDAKTTCDRLSKKFASAWAKEVSPGVSIHAAAMIKATATKKKIGADGLTTDQRKGLKTRKTHMQLDENGLNGYQKIAMVARPKQNDTMARNHTRAGNAAKAKWLAYRNFCIWITASIKSEILGDRPTGKAGVVGAWQIDHKYSVIKAFHQRVSPYVIGSKHNLIAIPWEENNKKRGACSISLDELFEVTGIDAEHAQLEFELFEQAYIETEIPSSIVLFLKMKEIADETGIPFKH